MLQELQKYGEYFHQSDFLRNPFRVNAMISEGGLSMNREYIPVNKLKKNIVENF